VSRGAMEQRKWRYDVNVDTLIRQQMSTELCWGNPLEGIYFECRDWQGNIIWKWVLARRDIRSGTNWHRIVTRYELWYRMR
jgi:hypothetical protein